MNAALFAQFTGNGTTLLVKCPYSKPWLTALGNNDIKGTWDNQQRLWHFKAKDSDSVIKLLYDYFGADCPVYYTIACIAPPQSPQAMRSSRYKPGARPQRFGKKNLAGLQQIMNTKLIEAMP